MIRGGETFRELVESALPFSAWKLKGYKELSYPAQVELNNRYIPFDLIVPETARLMGMKAPKGSGKTELIARVAKETLAQGRKVLVVAHRVQLTEALCDRVGVPSIYEIRSEDGSREELKQVKDFARLNGSGLCVDSLYPDSQAWFNPDDWKDATIIIDESEQVFWHLLNSSTCRKDRPAILRSLESLIAGALHPESEGRVILSDADLSDTSINLIKGLAGQPDLEPWLLVNHWKGTPWKTYHYPGGIEVLKNEETGKAEKVSGRENFLSALDRYIESTEKAVMVMTDSQKARSKYGTYNLEQRYKAKFPDKRVLRIDSETLELKDHPAFGCISRLNEVLTNFDIVICSPSVETGLSINIQGHFDSVWGFFTGGLAENSVRQMLARVREPVIAIFGLHQEGFPASVLVKLPQKSCWRIKPCWQKPS